MYSIRTPIEEYTTLMEYSGSNLIYVGKAVAGSAESSAVWQIQKLTYDGSDNLTNKEFADGTTEFSKIWTSRASYSYS